MPARLPDHLRRSPAQRAAEWRRHTRALEKAQGIEPGEGKRISGPSGPKGVYKSLFNRGEFVAIDGEGFTEGEPFEVIAPSSGGRYIAAPHYYALLTASDGSEIYEPNGRLSTQQCLDFLLDITDRNPKAILVCFGASYDMCQMLCHDLSLEQLTELSNPVNRTGLDVTLGHWDYRIEYRARKSLVVRRWPKDARKYEVNDNGVARYSPHSRATVWEVWGYFQESFVKVIDKWLPGDPEFAYVQEMKAGRKHFNRAEIHNIRRYNRIEVERLVMLMDKVRDAVGALDLTLSRWDGAGSIAAAMMRAHRVKDHMQRSPDAVFTAARHAYSGGHIECCQIGYHDATVYHYDVNSAYPAEFAELPSLAGGEWISGTGQPPEGFTVVRTQWEFYEGNSFYPLFYRQDNGTILYPRDGDGWHWFPEWKVASEYAEKFGAIKFNVVEWWHFKPAMQNKPFSWVRDYYARRQELVQQSKRSGKPNGEEKIIKLGLNSLYGKTAQQVGARKVDGEIREPAYFQLEWAGMVTAGCRAKLMRAAMSNMIGVIGFATDGIYSTMPLDVYAPEEKILGAWEAQTHAGITTVMPGVYWLHEKSGKSNHYSRGFDKEQMSDAEFIHSAWKSGKDSIGLDITRLIGIGSAITSETYWKLRGTFAKSVRHIALNGCNSKRYAINKRKGKPHLGLVPTVPCERHALQNDLFGEPIISAMHGIEWLDSPEDFGTSMEEEREAIDADNV